MGQALGKGGQFVQKLKGRREKLCGQGGRSDCLEHRKGSDIKALAEPLDQDLNILAHLNEWASNVRD